MSDDPNAAPEDASVVPTTGKRAVSGSLKDRIALFNNPDGQPLVPLRPFGQSGPMGSSGTQARGGMIGNQLPRMDPKTAGIVGLGPRRPSGGRESSGSRSASGARSIGRSASPSGSVGSSVTSGAALTSSGSPNNSRTSSPPTSPGVGHHSLLEATDPNGPRPDTPSSTRAVAGDDTTEQDAPATPVQAPSSAAGHDLVPQNLQQLGDKNGAVKEFDARSFAPSVTSSLASQYDPSSAGSENPQKMMQDVSGISTPMGTPRAAQRDLEGSARGEGSIGGDLDELQSRFDGLGVDQQAPDRDPTPEPPRDDPTKADGPSLSGDPNTAPDLDDLKKGKLHHDMSAPDTHGPMAKNPMNAAVGGAFTGGLHEVPVPPEERLEQRGPGGQRIPPTDQPDSVDEGEEQSYADSSEFGARTATASNASEEPQFTKGSTQWFEKQYKSGEKDREPSGDEQTEASAGDGTVSQAEEQSTSEVDPEKLKVDLEKKLDDGGNTEVSSVKVEDGEPVSEDARLKEAEADKPPLELQDEFGNGPEGPPRESPMGEKSFEDATETITGQGQLASQVLPPDGGQAAATETEGRTGKKPIQVQIEPAPIAQPAEEDEDNVKTPHSTAVPELSSDDMDDRDIQLPSVPSGESDKLQPLSHDTINRSDNATPIDPAIARAFPDVPDEEKPRVQVHVSTPDTTPRKSYTNDKGLPDTPLSVPPGQSKSLHTGVPSSSTFGNLAAKAASTEDSEQEVTDTP